MKLTGGGRGAPDGGAREDTVATRTAGEERRYVFIRFFSQCRLDHMNPREREVGETELNYSKIDCFVLSSCGTGAGTLAPLLFADGWMSGQPGSGKSQDRCDWVFTCRSCVESIDCFDSSLTLLRLRSSSIF